MTFLQMFQKGQAVGAIAYWKVQGVMVKVRLKDMRTVFNRIDYQIQPIDGKGLVWVEQGSLKPIDD